jgi:hypothetical protein
MAFYPDDMTIPTGVETGEFRLRMLRAGDVELDYDAVIASRDILLLRSGGRWPREGFTIAENLSDLEHHEAEHRAREAFTYTVMNPAETRCLGCVYINPLRRMLEAFPPEQQARDTFSEETPYVTFWARSDYSVMGLDARLFATLQSWFAANWAFPQVLFMANAPQTRHLSLYESAGLVRLLSLVRSEPPSAYHFYG